jgi:hypothetical protein
MPMGLLRLGGGIDHYASWLALYSGSWRYMDILKRWLAVFGDLLYH